MKYGKNCGLLMLACWCLFAKKGSSIIAHVIAHVGGAGSSCVFEYLLKVCICKRVRIPCKILRLALLLHEQAWLYVILWVCTRFMLSCTILCKCNERFQLGKCYTKSLNLLCIALIADVQFAFLARQVQFFFLFSFGGLGLEQNLSGMLRK